MSFRPSFRPQHALRVGCFNVLADCYSYSQLPSSSTPLPPFLAWPARKDALTTVLSSCGADILCLQEIDHFSDFYAPLLTSLEYSFHYVKRTGSRQDGCLIAYKPAAFDLLGYEEVHFDDIAGYMPSEAQRANVRRFNVAQLAVLQRKGIPPSAATTSPARASRPFVCANTHFYWNPRRPEVKRYQTEYLVHRVGEFMGRHSVASEAPVFVAGDFNSVPSSEAYAMFTQGFRYTLGDIAQGRGQASLGSDGADGIPTYGPDTKFLCDRSLSRLCRWMRVLGIDTKIIPAEEMNTSSADKKGRKKGAFDELFTRARAEKRVILTTSKTMRERAACPPSYLVSTQNLEQALVEVVREYGLTLTQDKFLTVCGKCGGEIEACAHDDPRISGRRAENKTVPPTDRDLFCCVECHQPYWWSEKETSSPARAMKMADKLYAAVVEQLNGASGGDGEGGVGTGDGSDGDDDAVGEEEDETEEDDEDGEALAAATVAMSLDAISASSNGTSNSISSSEVDLSPARLDALFAARNATVLSKTTATATAGAGAGAATTAPLSTAADAAGPSPAPPASDRRLKLAPMGPGPRDGGVITAAPPVFRSAYAAVHGVEASTTNWSLDFKDALDYVFVNDGFHVADAVVIPRTADTGAPAPPAEAEAAVEGLGGVDALRALAVAGPQPSPTWPSDHFMLLVDLDILDDGPPPTPN